MIAVKSIKEIKTGGRGEEWESGQKE